MNETKRVVVGVDGSSSAQSALAWAASEAASLGAELDVVCAWYEPYVVVPFGMPTQLADPAPFEAAAKEVLETAVSRLPAGVRTTLGAGINQLAVHGHPAHAILQVSAGAALLVVGSRGRGPVTGLLGSVSHQCVHHADCPVTVVPDWPLSPPHSRIVVGVDGSESSATALRWALRTAQRWDAELLVVHTWETPFPVEPWGVVVTPIDQSAFERAAGDLVHAMVEDAIAKGAPRVSRLQVLPVAEAAGPGLVAAAENADLIVVGSRGRGGFGALLVGSTSLYCLHHAHCPVTLVRTG